jgi:TonB family protein
MKHFFIASLSSVIIHLLLLYAGHNSDSKNPVFQMVINKNKVSMSVYSLDDQKQKAHTLQQTNKNNTSQLPESMQQEAGRASVSEEIVKIQNSISYPQMALELGLESDCKWKVSIDKEGKVKELQTIKKCQYAVFQEEFLKVIYSWKFQFATETVLEIPVSFKISTM